VNVTGLGSQPQGLNARTAGSPEPQQLLAGRPSKSQRVPARWFFESHPMKEGSVLRVPVPVSQSARGPRMILRMAETTG
jgi:hypothetical protein